MGYSNICYASDGTDRDFLTSYHFRPVHLQLTHTRKSLGITITLCYVCRIKQSRVHVIARAAVEARKRIYYIFTCRVLLSFRYV